MQDDSDHEAPANDADARLALHYDELPMWSALAGRLLLSRVPLPAAGEVLDLGCGTGFPALEIAERCGSGTTVVGVDVWRAALDRARSKAEVWGCGNAGFQLADASALPFADARFDLVVSCLGINNFADPAAAFAEARRVLKPGGTVALVTNLRGQFAPIYSALRRASTGDEAAQQRIAGQERSRASLDEVEAMAAAAGLRRIDVALDEEELRFANLAAMLRHHFVRLAFLGGWRQACPGGSDADLARALGASLGHDREIRLAIPLAYVAWRAEARSGGDEVRAPGC